MSSPQEAMAAMQAELQQLRFLQTQSAQRLQAAEAGLAAANARLQQYEAAEAMPAPAVVQPALEREGRINMKTAEIKKYSGHRGEDPELFFFNMEQMHLLSHLVSDKYKIVAAGLHLEKNALTWFRTWCAEGWIDNGANWEDFKQALRQQFQIQDPKAVARSKLFDLWQKGSLRDYTMYFKHLATIVGTMGDEDLLQLYLDRMDDDLAMNVRTHFPKTLAEAIRLAEEYANIIGDKGKGKGKEKGKPVKHFRHSGHGAARDQSYHDTRKDDPMDINALQVKSDTRGQRASGSSKGGRSGLPPAELERRMKEGLCFHCEAPGHQARNCPKRKSGNGQQRQRGRE